MTQPTSAASVPLRALPAETLFAVIACALAATACVFWTGWDPGFRFRVPKALALGVAGGACALVLAPRARSGFALAAPDLALVFYLAWGTLSAAVNGRVWTAGTAWLAQDLAAVLVLAATAIAVADDFGRHDRLHTVLIGVAVLVAAVVVGEALGLLPSVTPRARPGATLGNRNWVAAYLAPVTALAAVRLAWHASTLRAAALALLSLALVLTRCRGAWLAVLVVAMGATLAVVCVSGVSKLRPAARVAAVAALGAGVASSTPWPALAWKEPAPYAASLNRLLDYRQGTGRLRLEEWRIGWAVVAAHPWLGVGPRQWHDARDRWAHSAPGAHVEGAYGSPVPQSLPLQAAVETGLPGLLALTLALGWLLRPALVWTPHRPQLVGPAVALGVAGVHGLFEAPLYNAETAALFAVLAGALRAGGARPLWNVAPADRAARWVPPALVVATLFVIAVPLVRAAAALPPSATIDQARAAQRRFPLPEVEEDVALWLTRRGACAEAQPELQRALAWSPHHVTLLVQAALCAAAVGDRARAEVLLLRALELEPHDAERLQHLRRLVQDGS